MDIVNFHSTLLKQQFLCRHRMSVIIHIFFRSNASAIIITGVNNVHCFYIGAGRFLFFGDYRTFSRAARIGLVLGTNHSCMLFALVRRPPCKKLSEFSLSPILFRSFVTYLLMREPLSNYVPRSVRLDLFEIKR